MTGLLIKLFIKDKDNVQDVKVRGKVWNVIKYNRYNS